MTVFSLTCLLMVLLFYFCPNIPSFLCRYLDFRSPSLLLLSTEMLFSKISLSFNAFHKLIKPSNRIHKLDPLASGNAHPIWSAQAHALFSIHPGRAGAPRRRLLGGKVGTRDWLGPPYPLSPDHSDWFWAGGGGQGIQAWLIRIILGVV